MEVAGAIEFHQLVDDRLLFGILGKRSCFGEAIDDVRDGLSIESVGFPHPLLYFSVFLNQSAVESEHDRMGVGGVLHVGVELLRLLLVDTVVVVAGRSENQVLSLSKVNPFLHEVGVENDLSDFVELFLIRFEHLVLVHHPLRLFLEPRP